MVVGSSPTWDASNAVFAMIKPLVRETVKEGWSELTRRIPELA